MSDDWQARERSEHVADTPAGRFDAVIAPAGWDLMGVDAPRAIIVESDGSVVAVE